MPLLCHAGGKFSNLEGGVRVVSFLAGGWIPQDLRGSTSHALIATADWYSTFAALAGVDPTDRRAASYGLPPIDSLDQSSLLLTRRNGDVSQPPSTVGRRDIVLGGLVHTQPARFLSRAIISADVGTAGGSPKLYKLLLGTVKMATWSGPRFPNSTSAAVNYQQLLENCTSGCLYEVLSGTRHAVWYFLSLQF